MQQIRIELLQSIWHWVQGAVWEPPPEAPEVLFECPHWACNNRTPFEGIYCQHCCVRMTDVDALTLIE